MKKKIYIVRWEESHKVVVEATSEEEAIEKVNEGYGSDDSAEIRGGFEASELE